MPDQISGQTSVTIEESTKGECRVSVKVYAPAMNEGELCSLALTDTDAQEVGRIAADTLLSTQHRLLMNAQLLAGNPDAVVLNEAYAQRFSADRTPDDQEKISDPQQASSGSTGGLEAGVSKTPPAAAAGDYRTEPAAENGPN